MAKAGFQSCSDSKAPRPRKGQAGAGGIHPSREEAAATKGTLLLWNIKEAEEALPVWTWVNRPEVGPAFSGGQRRRRTERHKSVDLS